MRTLESLGEVTGRTILVRCDLNVPLDGDTITDDGRIRAALPTLAELCEAGAKVVVMSHLGRPNGTPDPRYSLAPVAQRLGELLGHPVRFSEQTIGDTARDRIGELTEGEVLVLENLRFSPGETSRDDDDRRAFAQQLAEGSDAFVSDGFGVVHRNQASVTDVATLLPSAAGRLVATEVEQLSRVTDRPERPFAVVLGGSKVSDKLGVIDALLSRVDTLLIGGGMAFTFLAAQGHDVAASLLEADQIETVRGYLRDAEERGVTLLTPTDVVVAERFDADAAYETVRVDQIADTAFGASGVGLDIGPDTVAAFGQAIAAARTVFWNGPMGVFEMESFAHGTRGVAQALADTDAFTVVGGGDSAAAVRLLGFSDDQFGHISTGGGASLEYLEGKTLPGLEVLA